MQTNVSNGLIKKSVKQIKEVLGLEGPKKCQKNKTD
jgi:hypothetical protein